MITVYVSPHCFLCRWVEPLLGGRIRVMKIDRDRIARQVNGPLVEDAHWLPAVPAVKTASGTYIGVTAPLLLLAAQLVNKLRRGGPDGRKHLPGRPTAR